MASFWNAISGPEFTHCAASFSYHLDPLIVFLFMNYAITIGPPSRILRTVVFFMSILFLINFLVFHSVGLLVLSNTDKAGLVMGCNRIPWSP